MKSLTMEHVYQLEWEHFHRSKLGLSQQFPLLQYLVNYIANSIAQFVSVADPAVRYAHQACEGRGVAYLY